MSLWKISERTFRGKQGLQPGEYLAPRSRHKAVPDSGDINQMVSPVIANNDCVHSVRSRNVTSDHKFLSPIQPVLRPRPAPFPNLVAAVLPFGNDTFQPLAASGTEHVPRGCFEIVRNADSGRLKL